MPIIKSHSNSKYNHWLLCTIVLASNMLSVTLKLKHLDNVKDDITELYNDELNVIVMTQLLVSINIDEVTTGWRRVPKEQNKPSSTFSNHGVKV